MELIRACGPQASVMLCGFKCHGPKWSLLRHKNNQYAALISTASAAHISNNTLHDTQDTHMCAHIHFSSRFYAVTHENMHNFINDSCDGETGLGEAEQAGCRHMVDSSTTDERRLRRAERNAGRWRDKDRQRGRMKMKKTKKGKFRAALQNK